MLFIICRLHYTRDFSVTPRPPRQRATVTDLKYTFKMPHHTLSVTDSQCVNAHFSAALGNLKKDERKVKRLEDRADHLRSTRDEMPSRDPFCDADSFQIKVSDWLSNVTHFYFTGCLHSWEIAEILSRVLSGTTENKQERKREPRAKKVNIHAYFSCAYVAKIQPVWKQLPEWGIGWNQTRPVSAISCVPTKRSTKEIGFPHKIICTWQGKGMKKETCICASFWALRLITIHK